MREKFLFGDANPVDILWFKTNEACKANFHEVRLVWNRPCWISATLNKYGDLGLSWVGLS